ncbi:glycosyltransferase family 2 protein [bacterium]|nr:glycosyltransferase family 2 protein [bacterium]
MVVSILIPTHNRASILKRTIESLAAVETPRGIEVELIVVANACTDDTLQVIDRMQSTLAFPVRCVEQPEASLNLARNRCIAEAKGEILAFLDDDVWVEREWLKSLIEIYESKPADLLAGRVTLWWEAVSEPSWSSLSVETLLSRLDYGDRVIELQKAKVAGANFAFRREVVERVGGFAAGLDRAGEDLLSGGDTEFVIRALSSGFRLFYVPTMSVRHWIPPYRTSIKYLSELARSRGRTRVAIAAKQRAFESVKFLRIGLAQLLIGGWRESFCSLLGCKKDAVAGHLLRMRGMGTISATIQYLRHKP